MQVLLIRHAKAEDSSLWSTDAARPLAPEGRRQAERLGRRLVELGLISEPLFTSPLQRARETAGLLCEAGAAAAPEACDELAPGHDLDALLPLLGRLREVGTARVALVGHLPMLADWAEQLVWGEACGRLVLKPAGVIALDLPDGSSLRGRCRLFWLTSPRLLP